MLCHNRSSSVSRVDVPTNNPAATPPKMCFGSHSESERLKLTCSYNIKRRPYLSHVSATTTARYAHFVRCQIHHPSWNLRITGLKAALQASIMSISVSGSDVSCASDRFGGPSPHFPVDTRLSRNGILPRVVCVHRWYLIYIVPVLAVPRQRDRTTEQKT